MNTHKIFNFSSMALIAVLFALLLSIPAAAQKSISVGCPGTNQFAEIKIDRLGNIALIPCPNKTVSAGGAAVVTSGNGGTGNSIAASQITTGVIDPNRLGGGVLSTATFLRGDGLFSPLGTGTKDATTFLRGNYTYSALSASDIPNLDAGKIATGSFSASQIPVLDASKVTTGVFQTTRLGLGTLSAITFLSGDGTFKTVSGTLSGTGTNTFGGTNAGQATTAANNTFFRFERGFN